MKKAKLDFDKFETLAEDTEGRLVSGFSPAFEGQQLMGREGPTNTVITCMNKNCVGCSGSGKD